MCVCVCVWQTSGSLLTSTGGEARGDGRAVVGERADKGESAGDAVEGLLGGDCVGVSAPAVCADGCVCDGAPCVCVEVCN